MIIDYPFIICILLILFYLTTNIFSYYKSKKINKAFNLPRKIVEFLFLGYFISVIYFTFGNTYSFAVVSSIDTPKSFNINLIPIKETISMFQQDLGTAFYNILGNLIMFIPLGIFIPILYKKKLNIFHLGLYGAICSLLIELGQGFIPLRCFDIDDIIINSLGAMVGFIIYRTITLFIKAPKVKKFLANISSTKPLFRQILLISIPILILINCSLYLSTYTFVKSRSVDKNNIVEVFKTSGNTLLKELKAGDEYYYLSKDTQNNYILSEYKYKLNHFTLTTESIFSKENLTLNDNKGSNLSLQPIEFLSDKIKTLLIFGELLNDKTLKIKSKEKEHSINLKAGYNLESIDVSKFDLDYDFESYFESYFE